MLSTGLHSPLSTHFPFPSPTLPPSLHHANNHGWPTSPPFPVSLPPSLPPSSPPQLPVRWVPRRTEEGRRKGPGRRLRGRLPPVEGGGGARASSGCLRPNDRPLYAEGKESFYERRMGEEGE